MNFFIVEEKDFKTLLPKLFSTQNFSNFSFFSKLQLTHILEFCFTFFTNGKMTEFRTKVNAILNGIETANPIHVFGTSDLVLRLI